MYSFSFFIFFYKEVYNINNNYLIIENNLKCNLRPQDQQLLTPSFVAFAQPCLFICPFDLAESPPWFLRPFNPQRLHS